MQEVSSHSGRGPPKRLMWFVEAFMDQQERRFGRWCVWGVALLSWMGFFLVLALLFRATGCNRGSEAGSKSMDVVAGSIGFEARSRTAFAAGATSQSQLLAGAVVRF